VCNFQGAKEGYLTLASYLFESQKPPITELMSIYIGLFILQPKSGF